MNCDYCGARREHWNAVVCSMKDVVWRDLQQSGKSKEPPLAEERAYGNKAFVQVEWSIAIGAFESKVKRREEFVLVVGMSAC